VGPSRVECRFILGILLLTPFASLTAQQRDPTANLDTLPTADDLLDRSIQASGGREGWLKLTSLHIKGELEIATAGMSGAMEIYSQAPAKVSECLRFDTGVFFCRAYDGAMGWQDDSQSGLKDLEGNDLEEMKRDADFYSALNEKKKYSTIHTTGESEFNGAKVYVVEAVRNDGRRFELYFSKESGLETGSKEFGGPDSQTKTLYFENYKPIPIGGVKLPTKIRSVTDSADIRFTIQEVEANPSIPETTFHMPVKSAREASATPPTQ
jgi:zinc protease